MKDKIDFKLKAKQWTSEREAEKVLKELEKLQIKAQEYEQDSRFFEYWKVGNENMILAAVEEIMILSYLLDKYENKLPTPEEANNLITQEIHNPSYYLTIAFKNCCQKPEQSIQLKKALTDFLLLEKN